jgi:hypothetical protein
MDIYQLVRAASVEQLIRWWNGEELPDWANHTYSLRQKVGSALGEAGPTGIRFLKSQLNTDDLHLRSIALSSLARKEVADGEVIDCLVEAFRCTYSDPRVIDVFKTIALEGLMSVERYPLDRAEVERLLVSEEEWLAASALAYLSRAYEEERDKILRAGMLSGNPKLRGRACTEVGFRRIRGLEGEVRALLSDADEYVARSAQIGCEVLELPQR